jgi:hypothetical protein
MCVKGCVCERVCVRTQEHILPYTLIPHFTLIIPSLHTRTVWSAKATSFSQRGIVRQNNASVTPRDAQLLFLEGTSYTTTSPSDPPIRKCPGDSAFAA